MSSQFVGRLFRMRTGKTLFVVTDNGDGSFDGLLMDSGAVSVLSKQARDKATVPVSRDALEAATPLEDALEQEDADE